jgi:hypothetical protein
MRSLRRRIVGTVVAMLVMSASMLVSTSAATSLVSAQADAFVMSTSPRANKGSAASLKVRNDVKQAYIRFEVPALAPSTQVTRATLRIYATTPAKCSLGVQVFRAASDTWSEATINWNNQPGAVGSALATSTWTTKNGYQSLDVSAAVNGAGPVSFVLRHTPGCNVSSDVGLNSREASTNPPQLEIETATVSTPACSDGTDNDADGLTDLADPGCTDASDTDETDVPPPPTPACSDGTDNDADGLTDLADPGCTDASDTDETDGPALPREKVIAAAGDIVCDPTWWLFDGRRPDQCQHRRTAALLSGADAVLPLGDLQYEDGTFEEFMAGYEPSWGQQAAKTYPVVGNHEYHLPGAQGYFDYWASKGRPTGARTGGYYSFDVGSWHIVALNSNCAAVPCAEGSPQNNYLEQDLAATSASCTLAYWHHPYFNSGSVHGAATPAGAKAFWDDLYAAGADVILNGHEHNYQRYAKQTSSGQATSNGIREFVVGTGGSKYYTFLDAKDPNFEVGISSFGVLRLYLSDNSYRWEFVGLDGSVLDSGGPVACN